MRQRAKKVLAILFLGFIVLFVVRFLYSFAVPVEDLRRPFRRVAERMEQSVSFSYKRAIASNLTQIAASAELFLAQGNVQLLEVFEKTGTLNSTTVRFDSDKKKLFEVIEKHKAKVKSQSGRGLCPARSLNVAIHVKAEAFDDMVENLKGVGELDSISVAKSDRTEEFRKLFARKESLEKHEKVLLKLRESQGTVEDFIGLEEKILDIQKEILSARIQLGDFTREESFCNVSYSLSEKKQPEAPELSLKGRLLHSLVWSIINYSFVVGAVLAALLVYKSIRVLKE